MKTSLIKLYGRTHAKKKEKMIFNYTRIVKNFLKKLERDKLHFFKKRKTNSSTVHLAKTPFKVMKF